MGEILGLGALGVLGLRFRVEDGVAFKGWWDIIVILHSSFVLLKWMWLKWRSETEIWLLIFLVSYTCISGKNLS